MHRTLLRLILLKSNSKTNKAAIMCNNARYRTSGRSAGQKHGKCSCAKNRPTGRFFVSEHFVLNDFPVFSCFAKTTAIKKQACRLLFYLVYLLPIFGALPVMVFQLRLLLMSL